MRFIGLFLVNILTGLPLAAPNPTIHDRGKVIQRKESVPTLHVTNLNVFVSNNSVVPSHISFHVVDPRPEQYGETDCVFSTNATYKSIYLSGWWDCDRNFDISFWLREDTLSLRRPWIQDPAEPEFIGLTDDQRLDWNVNATAHSCANATKTQIGMFYSRTRLWEFPITTLLS